MRYLSGKRNGKNYIDMHYTCAGALKGYDDLLTAGYGARSRQQSLDRGTAVSRYFPYVRQQDVPPAPLWMDIFIPPNPQPIREEEGNQI